MGQLLEDDSYLNQIAPTWRPIYRETIGQLANQTFVFSAHSRQTPCDLSSLISDWQRGPALAVMSYPRMEMGVFEQNIVPQGHIVAQSVWRVNIQTLS